MNPDYVQAILKTKLAGMAKTNGDDRTSWNKAIWAISKEISTESNRETREKEKEITKTSKASITNDRIQELMDNPMTEEEESLALRAIYQAQLSSGELSPQLLDKMDKIIGVGTGKDEEIQIVDFSEAFPDYATAIEYCGKPQPKVCKCGGVK